ncbi:hypothetical protein HY213_02740 [Candidatus Peregrinibacteria bacterium]|nr:hypothetical protein [Candidatus Peregrinibacteria bacterium]
MALLKSKSFHFSWSCSLEVESIVGEQLIGFALESNHSGWTGFAEDIELPGLEPTFALQIDKTQFFPNKELPGVCELLLSSASQKIVLLADLWWS